MRAELDEKRPAVHPSGRLSGVGEDIQMRLAIGVHFGHHELTCRGTDKNGGSLHAGLRVQDHDWRRRLGQPLGERGHIRQRSDRVRPLPYLATLRSSSKGVGTEPFIVGTRRRGCSRLSIYSSISRFPEASPRRKKRQGIKSLPPYPGVRHLRRALQRNRVSSIDIFRRTEQLRPQGADRLGELGVGFAAQGPREVKDVVPSIADVEQGITVELRLRVEPELARFALVLREAGICSGALPAWRSVSNSSRISLASRAIASCASMLPSVRASRATASCWTIFNASSIAARAPAASPTLARPWRRR